MACFTDSVRVLMFPKLTVIPHLNTNGLRIKPLIHIDLIKYLTVSLTYGQEDPIKFLDTVVLMRLAK